MLKKIKKPVLLSFLAALFLILGACSNSNDDSESKKEMDHGNMDMSDSETDDSGTDDNSNGMEGMDHSGDGEIPEGLEEAQNPTYPVGSEAIINAEHMEGMNGAEATIVGAYSTTVYSVTYTPTTGGEKVEDHKWVIHQELENADETPYKAGDEVVLNADHMEGMDGATAKVDTAERTTIYMVDYIDTKTGEEVTNHQWVTESELSAK